MSGLVSALADGTWLGVLLSLPLFVASVGRSLRGCREDVASPSSTDHAVDAELHRLAKGLSHDLAGPLRSLSVALELVEEDIETGDVGNARETLAVVRQQAAQLGRMTGALVHYCRSAWRPYPVRTESLGAVVGRVVAAADWSQGPTLSAEMPGITVRLEVEAFEAVLGDVLDNARLHHGGSAEGTVRVTACHVTHAGNEWLQVVVEDDGQGVPEEMHDAVFAIFRRSTTAAEGAGMGLSLAQTLTWRAGGHIDLDNSPMGGARVTLRWPLDPGDAP